MAPQNPRIPTSALALDYPLSLGVHERYEDAQKAVDFLADHDFPVQNCLIVGTDLKQVERVTGRLTTGKAGVRVSMQMSMGVAAIAAYVLGPGFGSWIFLGLAQTGGKNGVNYALTATLAIVVIALLFDLLLLLLGRATISKGIRA